MITYTAQLIAMSGDQYHTLTLTPFGRDVMAGRVVPGPLSYNLAVGIHILDTMPSRAPRGLDPERVRQIESLRLARTEMQRQMQSTAHQARRQHSLRTIGSISQVKFTGCPLYDPSPTLPTAQRCWCCRWAFSLATSCGERRSSPRWNAGLPGAPLLDGALRVLVITIGVVMALEQLGLATSVILTAFAITFGALMLGLANLQLPTPKRSFVSSLGVGNWALGVDTCSL
jgi:hypothetical protein